MASIFDCTDPEQRVAGLQRAREALERGDLVVIPTDTVYGLAADAFNPAAVQRLQAAKGRGRQSPPAVLVPDTVTINRVATRVPGAVHQLTPRFWPGGLTLVLQAQTGLGWDLGDAEGVVAVRMPRDDIALELLRGSGPLAVSSANVAGLPPATTAAAAADALGGAVAVVLDGGDEPDDNGAPGPTATSTILDATIAVATGKYRVLRRGVVSVEQLRIALGDAAVIDADPSPHDEQAVDQTETDAAADGTAQPAPASAAAD